MQQRDAYDNADKTDGVSQSTTLSQGTISNSAPRVYCTIKLLLTACISIANTRFQSKDQMCSVDHIEINYTSIPASLLKESSKWYTHQHDILKIHAIGQTVNSCRTATFATHTRGANTHAPSYPRTPRPLFESPVVTQFGFPTSCTSQPSRIRESVVILSALLTTAMKSSSPTTTNVCREGLPLFSPTPAAITFPLYICAVFALAAMT